MNSIIKVLAIVIYDFVPFVDPIFDLFVRIEVVLKVRAASIEISSNQKELIFRWIRRMSEHVAFNIF